MDLEVIIKARKGVSLQKSKFKTILITFFDKQDVPVPEGQTVNSVLYVEVTRRLLKRISRARPQLRAEGSWFLLHDSVPSHSSLVVKTFLARHYVVEISPPSYSHDLAPGDFFLFPKVKTALKGKRFQDIEKNLTAELNAVPLQAFSDCFQKLFERCNKCIQVDGDYFE
jgi:hypothetical protein